jgi:hypothetical protein
VLAHADEMPGVRGRRDDLVAMPLRRDARIRPHSPGPRPPASRVNSCAITSKHEQKPVNTTPSPSPVHHLLTVPERVVVALPVMHRRHQPPPAIVDRIAPEHLGIEAPRRPGRVVCLVDRAVGIAPFTSRRRNLPGRACAPPPSKADGASRASRASTPAKARPPRVPARRGAGPAHRTRTAERSVRGDSPWSPSRGPRPC